MKIAVIGARGYIGQHLCEALSGKGVEVQKFSSGSPRGISESTGLLPEDFEFDRDVSAVYYLAQSPRYRQVPQSAAHLISVNCTAAVQAAEAARRAGIERFVYTSTGNVYAPSFDPMREGSAVNRGQWYGLSKVMAEDALALFSNDLKLTIGRIFGAYGPGQADKLVPMIANSVRSGKDVSVDQHPSDASDDGGLRVSLIYIDDLIRSLVALLDLPGTGVVNLAGTEAVSIRRLATVLGQAYGKSPVIKRGERVRQSDLIADMEKHISLFGAPQTSLEEGIARVVAAEAA